MKKIPFIVAVFKQNPLLVYLLMAIAIGLLVVGAAVIATW